MRKILALAAAFALSCPSEAQVVKVKLIIPQGGMSLTGPARSLSSITLSSGISLKTNAPPARLVLPAASAPALQVSAPAVAVPVVPAVYGEPVHWNSNIIVDRDYARLLDAGQAAIESKAVEPAALETLRAKDGKIYSHMLRVGIMAGLVATAMGATPEAAYRTAMAARLHDIGKTSEAIRTVVNKEGKLTAEEREVMMTHPQAGVDILFAQTDIPHDILWAAMRAALSHHEAVDGTGYPQGLKGDQIPLEAKITNVVDYFDALLEHRPYRAGMTIPQALEIMQKVKDKFDPQVWSAFLSVVHQQ